ncbi:hypothetical protein NP233_g4129 [Leucocoprinus birnbaumii]|uniref:Uncharacterized protein n=1 Tax=Leucocoprinus birnbaumii TaxID=56174 RepID=A0AAD5VV90_9AGAR|nr:hypothetical protein NP233_g4129 [Leucocoprinus birnbaumii]
MALQPVPSASNGQLRPPGPSASPGRRLADALNTIQEEYNRLLAERDALRLELTRTQTLANEQDAELTMIRRAIWNLQNQLENHRQRFEQERRKLFDELKHQRAAAGLAPPSPLRELSNPPPLSASASTSSAHSVIQIPEDRNRPEFGLTSTYDRKLKGRAREPSDADDDFREPKRMRSSDGGSHRAPSSSMPVDSPTLPMHHYPHHHSHHHHYHPLPTSNANSAVNGHGHGPNRPSTTQSLSTPPPPPPTTGNKKKTSPAPPMSDDLTLSNVPPVSSVQSTSPPTVNMSQRDVTKLFIFTKSKLALKSGTDFTYGHRHHPSLTKRHLFISPFLSKHSSLVDPALPKNGDSYIRSVRFSPDGDYLATGAEDSKVRIWNIKQRTLRDVFAGHSNEIYALDYSQNGRYVVSGSADCSAIIWDLHFPDKTHKCLRASDSSYDPKSTEAGITSISISASNSHVAGGCLDHFIRIWSMRTGELVAKLRGHEDSVYAVRFMNDVHGLGRLVSGSLDCTVKVWDVSSLNVQEGISDDDRRSGSGMVACPLMSNLRGHQDYVLTVACSSDNRYVISGAKDRSLILWDPAERLARFRLNGHTNSVISADFSGSYLATASGDMCCRIWSLSTLASPTATTL